MTDLAPSTTPWPSVPRIETTTALLGGPGGPLNAAPQALLDRTEAIRFPAVHARTLGVKGDYNTDDGAAFEAALAWCHTNNRTLDISDMVIRIHNRSIDLPPGIRLIGNGPSDINYYAPNTNGTTDGSDKLRFRPGYKNTIRGANLIFSGAANKTYTTNRVDGYSSFTYALSAATSSPPIIRGVGVLLDVDMYDAGGTITTPANDNVADYDVGLILRCARSKLTDCNLWGYWGKASYVVHSQYSLETNDSDYNTAINCWFSSVALIGDETGDNGLTGTNHMGCGYYSAGQYHNTANAAWYKPEKSHIFVDGKVGAGPGLGIRGHRFDGHIRGSATKPVELRRCRDITISLYAMDVGDTYTSRMLHGMNETGSVYLNFCAKNQSVGFGAKELAGEIASNSAVHCMGGTDQHRIELYRGGAGLAAPKTIRLFNHSNGDSIVHLSPDGADTGGVAIFRDESESGRMMVRVNSGDAFYADGSGNTRTYGNDQATSFLTNGGYFGALSGDADIRAASGGIVRFRIVGSSVLLLSSTLLRPQSDNAVGCGSVSGRWTEVCAVAGTINTSDEREKQDIGAIPDEWLDAWADVEYVRYKWRDAVAKKGDGARWHVGLIAQRVRDVFAAHGIDPFAIGVLCYDEWDAHEIQPAEYKEVLQDDGTVLQVKIADAVVVPAGNRFGLRYSEATNLELALMRRTTQRQAAAQTEMQAKIAALQDKLAALEN